MSNKKPEFDGQFPGVDPIPEPDRPDQAATDKLDDLVLGVLEDKDQAKADIGPDTENYDKLRKIEEASLLYNVKIESICKSVQK